MYDVSYYVHWRRLVVRLSKQKRPLVRNDIHARSKWWIRREYLGPWIGPRIIPRSNYCPKAPNTGQQGCTGLAVPRLGRTSGSRRHFALSMTTLHKSCSDELLSALECLEQDNEAFYPQISWFSCAIVCNSNSEPTNRANNFANILIIFVQCRCWYFEAKSFIKD